MHANSATNPPSYMVRRPYTVTDIGLLEAYNYTIYRTDAHLSSNSTQPPAHCLDHLPRHTCQRTPCLAADRLLFRPLSRTSLRRLQQSAASSAK